MISLRQLEVLRAVVLTGSISGAAQLLHVSPAAVSRMLKHTESQVGYQLFQRTREGLVPSPEAIDLLEDLDAIHDRLTRIQQRLSSPRSHKNRLRIGASPGLGLSLLPKAFQRALRQDPELELELGVLHVDEVVRSLEFQRYDFALTIYDIDDPRLIIKRIGGGELVCLAEETHPLADRPEISVADLADYPIIGFSSESFQQRIIDRLAIQAGVELTYSARCRLMVTACALVQEGIGITLLDSLTVFNGAPPGTRIIPLRERHQFPLNFILHRKTPPSQVTISFVRDVEAVVG